MDRSQLVDLLVTVAHSPPRSMLEAHALEAPLIPHMGVPGIDDFVVALSLYEPTDLEQDGIVGYRGLRVPASETLHELGQHDFCLHDRPDLDR